jgi:hypothetical protein
VTTTAQSVDDCDALCPTARALLEKFEPYPAVLMNARLDLLAYNRAYVSFFPALAAVPTEERNCLWLAFTNREFRRAIVDWDEAVGRMVAEYRTAMAGHLGNPAWQLLVSRLLDASPEFAARWQRHDVRRVESSRKRARHPELGLLNLDYTNLWLDPPAGTRIVAFTPADARTATLLEASA